jgi:hypothetical protein
MGGVTARHGGFVLRRTGSAEHEANLQRRTSNAEHRIKNEGAKRQRSDRVTASLTRRRKMTEAEVTWRQRQAKYTS